MASRAEMDKRESRNVGIFRVGRGNCCSFPIKSKQKLKDLCGRRADKDSGLLHGTNQS